MIDLVKFDNFLNYELWLKTAISRKIIIINYKKYYKERKSVIEFEECLSNLGYYDITIENISRYIMNWNYRQEMDKKVEKHYEKRS